MIHIQADNSAMGRGKNILGSELGANYIETTPSIEIVGDWQDNQEGELTDPELKFNDEWRLDGALVEKFTHNRELEESIISSLRKISRYLHNQRISFRHVNAYLDNGSEAGGYEFPVICIEANIASVDEWNRIESDIENIVRESETEEVMIYTIVESAEE